MNNNVRVYETETEGHWTHSLAADGEGWSKGEAIRRAREIAVLNGGVIDVDLPNETKRRAAELGIDPYAKPTRKSLDRHTKVRKGFDPFASG